MQSVVAGEAISTEQLQTIGDLLKGALATQTGAEQVVSEQTVAGSEVLKEIVKSITDVTGTSTTEEEGFSLGFGF